MKTKRSLLAILASVFVMSVALLAFAACSDPVTVEISQTTAETIVGGSVTLTATASDGSEITWTTDNDDVATVRNGLVRGVGEGTAVITASSGDASATCTVTVSTVTVTITPTSGTLELGETLQLTATASDNGTISWSSSNEDVATVDKNGLVTGVGEGTANIVARRGSAGSATCAVTVQWSSKPSDYTEMTEGAETDVAQKQDTYIYWSAKAEWGMTTVTVEEAWVGDGKAHLTYSGNNGNEWYGMQLFYKKSGLTEGKAYKLTFTVDSEEAGQITVNGTVVTLEAKAGNQVEVFYTEPGASLASVSIQMGVESEGPTIAANTLVFSAFKFEEVATQTTLSVPTAVSIEEGAVTITDDANTEGVADYSLQFWKDGVREYAYAVDKTGFTIDDTYMEDGEYDVRVMANAANVSYQSSDLSAALATYTVSHGALSYDMQSSVEDASILDRYYYWTEFNGIAEAPHYENAGFTVTLATGGNWYSNQIFYKDSGLLSGETYNLSMKINATVAGSITIAGEVIELEVGDNTINLENKTQGASSTFSIQFGVNGGAALAEGTFVFSEISVTAA